MRSVRGLLLVVGVTAVVAGCWPFAPSSPGSPAPSPRPTIDETGSPPLSSFPVPGRSTKPLGPSPTIEIPPPRN